MRREVAWRVFAGEYNASSYRYAEEGDRAPNYLVTPLGARINRLFLSGVLTDIENIGTEEEPMWRARVSDPTGVFYLSAGQYQPEASMALAKMTPPAFVAVIGKVRPYTTDDGTVYVSVRPETVKEVDEKLRDFWVLNTCKDMKARLEAMGEAMKMDPPKKEELMALGFSEGEFALGGDRLLHEVRSQYREEKGYAEHHPAHRYHRPPEPYPQAVDAYHHRLL